MARHTRDPLDVDDAHRWTHPPLPNGLGRNAKFDSDSGWSAYMLDGRLERGIHGVSIAHAAVQAQLDLFFKQYFSGPEADAIPTT